jgi:antitoxin component YwqK of YwqJK toxin-antitoxin module
MLESEGQYFDGYEDGLWKYYYESSSAINDQTLGQRGKLHIEANYNKGHRTGLWRVYYESGALQSEGLFEGPDIHFEEYHPSGILSSEGFIYNNYDTEIGSCKYFYESGVLESEGSFENGLENGHWKMYYPSGYLESEYIWNHGNIIISRNYSDLLIYNMCTEPLLEYYL